MSSPCLFGNWKNISWWLCDSLLNVKASQKHLNCARQRIRCEYCIHNFFRARHEVTLETWRVDVMSFMRSYHAPPTHSDNNFLLFSDFLITHLVGHLIQNWFYPHLGKPDSMLHSPIMLLGSKKKTVKGCSVDLVLKVGSSTLFPCIAFPHALWQGIFPDISVQWRFSAAHYRQPRLSQRMQSLTDGLSWSVYWHTLIWHWVKGIRHRL